MPRGSKPRVASAPCRKSVPHGGYVLPSTGGLVVDKPAWFNYETVIGSLRNLMDEVDVPEGKRPCVVLDNAPWHKKAVRLVQTGALEGYADIRERMTLLFLPPYSPDLNPIGQVWRVARREVTHNVYFPDAATLSATLDGYFAGLRKPNEKLSSPCTFKHKS